MDNEYKYEACHIESNRPLLLLHRQVLPGWHNPGCTVQKHTQQFRKRDEWIPKVLVGLLRGIINNCNDVNLSQKHQRSDGAEYLRAMRGDVSPVVVD